MPGDYPAILKGAHVFFQVYAAALGEYSFNNPYAGSFANLPYLIDFVSGLWPDGWVIALQQVHAASIGMDDNALMNASTAEWERFWPPVIAAGINSRMGATH